MLYKMPQFFLIKRSKSNQTDYILKTFLYLFLCMFCAQLSKCQNLVTKIDVHITDGAKYLYSDSVSKDVNLYRYKIIVNEEIKIKNKQKKLVLKLNNPSSFNSMFLSLFFRHLKVVSVVNKKEIDVPFDFNGETLIVYTNDKSNICITYEYQPDFFFRNISSASTYILPCMQDWHSWYFTSHDMIIKSFKAHTIDDLYFMTNLSDELEHNYNFDKSVYKSSGGISFFALTKSLYTRRSICLNNKKIDAFLMNQYYIDTVYENTNRKYKLQLKSKTEADSLSSKIGILSKYIGTLSSNFNSRIKNISVIEAPLSVQMDDANAKWARTYKYGKSSSMAIIDSSFWFDNSLVHELLHMYIYDNRIKHDSAYYFFNESFVEYLSVYFTYEDSTMRDSVFQAKHSKYETSKHTHSSVFELKDNMLSEGSNSSDLIYLETPYKIHQFGKNIGEKRFIKIIRKMYKRKVNISTMKKYLYRAGVGKTQIRTFLSGL